MSAASLTSTRRTLGLVVLVVAGALLVLFATDGDRKQERPKTDNASTQDRRGEEYDAEQAASYADASAVVRALDEALRARDKTAFLSLIHPSAKEFANHQERWLDNIAKLPVSDLAVRAGDLASMTALQDSGKITLPVFVTMRLRGYDERPATTEYRYTFVRALNGDLLVSDDGTTYSSFKTPHPWDNREIMVRRNARVLGIFDEKTVGRAPATIASISAALEVVDGWVPQWSGRAVAYVVDDPDTLGQLSLMSEKNTGGVAFPVYTERNSEKLAGYRFIVRPGLVDDPIDAGYVFRHELTHVALADLDDQSPTWLTEGVADYIAISVFSPAIQHQVLASLGVGRTSELASGEDFYESKPNAHYAAAAAAVTFLVHQQGIDTVWRLLREFDRKHPFSAADVDIRMKRIVGMNSQQLLRATLTWLET